MRTTWITGGIAAVGADRVESLPRQRRTTSTAGTVIGRAASLLLVADPDPILLQTLSTGLFDRGVNRVIRIGSVEGVDEVLADHIVGQLALIGLGFGDPAIRLIADLRTAGWPRVIALAPTIDPGPLLDAVRAGATGVLRRPPGTPVHCPDPGPVPRLSGREVEILRLVADGRTNGWIAAQLSLSSLSVKKHLARMARKFGHGGREQLVALAFRGGIID
jgi:DNA-binding CsgD family transcriptional regulator